MATNQQFLPDYGDRDQHDERITTSFVASAVNYGVSKRFVKSQQTRWSQRGAYLLLQVRTHVLNKEFRTRFQQWYPKDGGRSRAGDASRCITPRLARSRCSAGPLCYGPRIAMGEIFALLGTFEKSRHTGRQAHQYAHRG